jgi:two-component system sensor histidine kinase YesM
VKWEHLSNLYKRLNYKTQMRDKLILSYILLFGIWAAYFTFDSYGKSVNILQEQFKVSIKETIEQVQLHLSYRFEEMEHISNLILNNHEIQQTLQDGRYRTDPLKQLDDYYLLRDNLSDLLVTYSKYQVQILLPYKTLYTSEELNFVMSAGVQHERWYREIVDHNAWKVWHGPSSSYGHMPESLSLVKRLFTQIGDDGLQAAVLKVDVNENDIYEQLSKISLEQQGTMDLVDADGNVITSNDKSRKGVKLPSLVFHRVKGTEFGIFEFDDGKAESIIAYRKVEAPGWYIVTTSPKENITEASTALRNYNIAVMAALLTVSIVLVAFSTKVVTKRIHELGKRMSNLDHNRFDDLIHIQYSDEFSKIERKYNEMSLRLRNLIEEIYRAEMRKNEAEMKALQAQINPHFLYNTLDTINWMVVDKGDLETSKMVTTLGRFFRLSLSKGKDVITLGEELEITKLYLKIQQVRFNNRLDIDYDVDETVLDYVTVKLILQPIVENAIKHGIQNNKDKRGMIRIEVEKSDDRICVRVIDDGSEPEPNGQPDDRPLDKSGYGLQSVLERIRLNFGDDCTLHLVKGEPSGMIVSMEWPAIKSEELS